MAKLFINEKRRCIVCRQKDRIHTYNNPNVCVDCAKRNIFAWSFMLPL